jgi:anti-anti-sigma regulatory factor
MATSDMRQPQSDGAWSLGAVLAESEVDGDTYVVVLRPEVGLDAALAVGRRLLGLCLAGYTTIVAEIAAGERVSGTLIAVLLQSARKLDRRNARLVVSAADPAVRERLARAGLEVSEL